MDFISDYDVIIVHGPGCNDGATAAWCIWRTLPLCYRKMLEKEGGFYSSYDVNIDKRNQIDPPLNSNKKVKQVDLSIDTEKLNQVGTVTSFINSSCESNIAARIKKRTLFELDTKEINYNIIVDNPKNNNAFIHPNSPEGAMELQRRGFPVVFVFIQPSEGVPEALIFNKRVLILDLDMGDALIPVINASKSVLLVDHHNSSQLTIAKHSRFLYQQTFDKFSLCINTSKSECGATLIWKITYIDPIPQFLDIVRIGDNWQWDDNPGAKYILKSLYIQRTFRSFTDIENTFINWNLNVKLYEQDGKAITEYEKSLIKRISKHCDIGFLQTNDGKIYTIAYIQANVLHSEVGANIKWYAERRFKIPIDFCATWKYVSHKEIVSVSLRDPNPNINLYEIAKNIKGANGKGGGHTSSASFTFIGIENLHSIILKTKPETISTSNHNPNPIYNTSSKINHLSNFRQPSLPNNTNPHKFNNQS